MSLIDKNTQIIGFRMRKPDIEQLDNLAQEEERSRSAMIRRLINLAVKGRLKEESQKLAATSFHG